jgi:HK97 family phage portal protein
VSIWRGVLSPADQAWLKTHQDLAQRADSLTIDGLARLVTGSQTSANVYGGDISAAEQSVAIASAVDLIASLVSELPIDVFSGKGAARREVAMPSWLEDPSGDGYGVQDWIYRLIYSYAYRGNIYGDVLSRSRQATGNGFITQMEWWHPDKVHGAMIDGEVKWTAGGTEVPAGRMYHRRAFPVPGQIEGQSPISRAATQVGISLAATRFGKGWFDSDANPTGILRNTLGQVDQEKAKGIKDRFMAALRGTREPIVMGRGWEWDTISVSPEESQFLQTMGWSEAQCARIFGPGIAEILGYETGGGMTYANVQDRDITLLKYAVGKWIRRVERVLSDMLPKPQYVILNRDALLETNTLARYQAYALALQGKPWKEVNEVREKENLEPIDDSEPEPAPADEPPAGDEPSEDPEGEQ